METILEQIDFHSILPLFAAVLLPFRFGCSLGSLGLLFGLPFFVFFGHGLSSITRRSCAV